MESHFGHDFGDVRVHTDAQARESARAVDARAYSVGKDIAFGEGQFRPRSEAGLRLIAHELGHVVEQRATSSQSPTVFRAPAPKAPGTGNLKLPWKHGDVSLFEKNSSGIHFLVSVGDAATEAAVLKVIPTIGKQIADDNARITDAAFKVNTCIISGTTTRFALLNGVPVLMLDVSNADAETAAHEMGHAIFHYLSARGASKAADAPQAVNFRERIADIYRRLAGTKMHTEDKETHAAGLWIVDPTQWQTGGSLEHPWDDPDEFFASAKAAFQLNLAGLKKSIEKFKKIDPAVETPANELLVLLGDFFTKGALPKKALPSKEAGLAEKELARGTGVSKVEDTIMSGTPLEWLLKPETRPVAEEAEPQVTAPTQPGSPTKRPNLVTGPGGIVEKQQERMRERVIRSVEEIP